MTGLESSGKKIPTKSKILLNLSSQLSCQLNSEGKQELPNNCDYESNDITDFEDGIGKSNPLVMQSASPHIRSDSFGFSSYNEPVDQLMECEMAGLSSVHFQEAVGFLNFVEGAQLPSEQNSVGVTEIEKSEKTSGKVDWSFRKDGISKLRKKVEGKSKKKVAK